MMTKLTKSTHPPKENELFGILVPGVLNLENLAREKPPGFKYFNIDFAYYVVATICLNISTYKEYQIAGSVPLSSQILKRICYNYEDHIQWLIQLNVIETNGSYIPGKRSKAYNLAITYRKAIYKYHFPSCPKVKDATRSENYYECLRQFGSMVKTITDLCVHPDAYEFIKEECHRIYTHQAPFKYGKVDYQGNSEVIDPFDLYEACDGSLQRIEKNSLKLTLDDYGRFHNNISLMKSELRHFLYIPHKPKFCLLDISNSQFYLLGSIINLIISNNYTSKSLFHLNNTISNLYSPLLPLIFNDCIPIMCGNENVDAEAEIKTFLEVTRTGQFYEYLRTENMTRDEVKNEIFPLLFSNPLRKVDRSIFTSKFPVIWQFIVKLQLEREKAVSKLLQAVESHLMLKRIYRRILDEMPGISLISIHDSFMAPIDKAEGIEQIIKEEFQKFLGAEPHIKRTDLSPELAKFSDGVNFHSYLKTLPNE